VSSRRRYSAKRGPKNNVWSVLVLEDVAISTTTIESAIVAPADWSGVTGTGFEKGTLLRIRGWLGFTLSQTSAAQTTLFGMIYVTDANDVVHSPALAASYATEDVLWSWGQIWPTGNASALEKNATLSVPVDVKSMRKIDSSKQVRLALIVSTTSGVLISGVLRGLVRKSG